MPVSRAVYDQIARIYGEAYARMFFVPVSVVGHKTARTARAT